VWQVGGKCARFLTKKPRFFRLTRLEKCAKIGARLDDTQYTEQAVNMAILVDKFRSGYSDMMVKMGMFTSLVCSACGKESSNGCYYPDPLKRQPLLCLDCFTEVCEELGKGGT